MVSNLTHKREWPSRGTHTAHTPFRPRAPFISIDHYAFAPEKPDMTITCARDNDCITETAPYLQRHTNARDFFLSSFRLCRSVVFVAVCRKLYFHSHNWEIFLFFGFPPPRTHGHGHTHAQHRHGLSYKQSWLSRLPFVSFSRVFVCRCPIFACWMLVAAVVIFMTA